MHASVRRSERTRLAVTVIVIMVATVVSGCSGSKAGSDPTGPGTVTIPATTTTTIPGPVDASGTWTVMVYAVGDNNLEPALLTDMQEMRAVTGDVPNLTFLVLADRSDAYSSDGLGRLGDWTTAKLIEVSNGRFTEVDDLGEKNLGNPQVVRTFLERGASYAPADHYALVFWDHGSPMDFGLDESHGDLLEASELVTALERGLQASGVGTLDIIGFDACLMASLEMASALHPYASYMIASEELEPWEGWDYGGFGYLGVAIDPTIEMLGESLLSAYVNTSGPAEPSVTMSVLDLRRFPSFYDALGSLTEVALDNLDSSAAEFGRRRNKVTKFGSDPDPASDWFMVDLGQLLNRMGRSGTPVAPQAARASELLAEMVVANTTGEASTGARGLSVYFPPAPEWFPQEWYDRVGSPVWGSFLRGYFEAGRALPPSQRPSLVPDTGVEFFFDDYGITVTTEIGPGAIDSVVSVVLWSGIEDPDGTVTFYEATDGFEGAPTDALGEEQPGKYFGIYDLTRMTLTDGEDTVFGFTQISLNEEITFATLTVPMWYRPPIDVSAGRFGDPVDVTLIATIDTTTGEQTKGLFASSGGTVGPFQPDPQGLLFPKVARRVPGGDIEWVAAGDVGLWADLSELFVDFADLPSGMSLRSELTVADFGGNTATAVVSTLVP